MGLVSTLTWRSSTWKGTRQPLESSGSCLPAGSGSQKLKVIVPEVNQSDSSSDSSPRHHKEASKSQEFQSDLSPRGFKEFLVAKNLDGVNSSEKL